MRVTLSLAATLLAILGCLHASQALSSDAAPDPTPPCAAPEFRQFDFWLGNWEVRDAGGQVVGTNLVERKFGDCVVQENWTGQKGMRGSSFNIYSPATRQWHQTWVDDHGTLLELDGEYRDGKMVLVGEIPAKHESGKSVRQRISWEKQADGQVRQLWETSGDGGRTWTVAFDGWYSRIPAAPRDGAPSGTPRR